ncbi:hypothetical protein O3P69_014252 [Scylla paramamosain]|uniref:Uncharacterized protein n=1 Tax=Scylla paramamosain TaxID=85552 RepID=A0AAW0TAE6_SCYPA
MHRALLTTSPLSRTRRSSPIDGRQENFALAYLHFLDVVGMKKYPRSQTVSLVKKGATALFVLEVGVFAGLYYVYHRMNTDRDFRYYMKNNYSTGLEAFYTVGEFMNSEDRTRRFDEAVWAQQFGSESGSTKQTKQ